MKARSCQTEREPSNREINAVARKSRRAVTALQAVALDGAVELGWKKSKKGRWWEAEGSLFPTAAATAAKSLQSCPTLCDPIDGSPPGSPVPGILQARTLEWVAISFSNAWKWKVKVKSLSNVWLSDPMDCSLPRLLHSWDFPGKSTEVGCHCPIP